MIAFKYLQDEDKQWYFQYPDGCVSLFTYQSEQEAKTESANVSKILSKGKYSILHHNIN